MATIWPSARVCDQERVSEESKESESFKSLLHARTQEFVEEVCNVDIGPPPLLHAQDPPRTHTHTHTYTHTQVLSPYFGGMIGFVKDMEPLLERGQKDRIRVDEREALSCHCHMTQFFLLLLSHDITTVT